MNVGLSERDPSAFHAAPASPSGVLDPRQLAFALQLLLTNDPLHLHFEAPLWTPHALAEVLRDEFDCSLTDAALQRCLFELGLLPGDPLLPLERTVRACYSQWIDAELPRRIAQGQAPWWVCENALPTDAAVATARGERSHPAWVIAAINPGGQLAWWFCRGMPDLRSRMEFVSRLQQLSPDAVLLACGREASYAEVVAQLPPAPRGALLLDTRAALAAAPAAATAALFRPEVFAARQRRIEGDVLVLQPLPLRLLSGALLLLLLLLLLLGSFGHYARTQTATGVLMPASGVLRLQAPQAGVLQTLEVALGDRVEAGQALARIASAQVDGAGAQVDARIIAELDAALAGLDAEADSQRRQGELEQQRLLQSLAVAQRQQDELAQQFALQAQRQQLVDDNLARSRKLADAGVIARVQLEELEQQALSAKVQTLALSRERTAAGASTSEARNRLAQQPLDAAQRLAGLEQRRTELRQRLAQARLSAGATLRAPIAGRVAAVLAQAGSTIAAGTPLLVVVDDQQPLLAELLLPSRAIGFIRVGQQVELKIDAFPYQQYGSQRGKVREISAAALAAQDLNLPTTSTEPLYLVRVALATQRIAAFGEPHALRAGMQVQADIVIDRPRIVDWLLQPLYALRGH